MKTIITILMVIAVSITSASSLKRDPYHLIIEGKFIAKKHITYTIYKMDNRGIFVKQLQVKARKYYSLYCTIGEKYIVRFEDKNHNVKFLMIDVTQRGYFIADVDFTKSYDAVLKYTKVGYRLEPFNNVPMAKK